MEKISPQKAFDFLTDEMGFRPLAVSLYRFMTSKDPILVVKNESRAQWLESVMTSLTKDVNICFTGENTGDDDFTIISKEKYKEEWKNFSGEEICIVEDEATVKNPGVNLVMETLVKQHAKQYSSRNTLAEHFLTKVHKILLRISDVIEKINERVPLQTKAKKKQRKIKKIVKRELEDEHERELVFHIFELRHDGFDEKK